MSKKPAKQQTQNTSAPAQPETVADVSVMVAAPAATQAIASTAVDGGNLESGNQEFPLVGAAPGEVIGEFQPPVGGEIELDFTLQQFTHRISGQAPKGFYRAGRYWPPVGVDVCRLDFDDVQWAALEGEPKITIKPL